MDLGDEQPKKRPLSITYLLPGEFPEQELDMYVHGEDKASKRELIFKKMFLAFLHIKILPSVVRQLARRYINIPHKDNTFNVSFVWFDYPCELQDAKINCGLQLKQERQER